MKKLILGFVLIGLLLLVGCQEDLLCPDCVCTKQEAQIQKGKAMLDIDMYTWGINELDESDLFFQYVILNFGDVEAKDIKVKCKIEDMTEKVLAVAIDNYGNLASKSVALDQVITKKPSSIILTKEYYGYCYVASCSNCEILYKRIPELIESYEGK